MATFRLRNSAMQNKECCGYWRYLLATILLEIESRAAARRVFLYWLRDCMNTILKATPTIKPRYNRAVVSLSFITFSVTHRKKLNKAMYYLIQKAGGKSKNYDINIRSEERRVGKDCRTRWSW